ncbi:hypothetical protein CGCTS75_v004562 [Colletotrichum tropicale]|nr:hypothetical protein CGCTS75_v004562 [Colletotrichum tropicale]
MKFFYFTMLIFSGLALAVPNADMEKRQGLCDACAQACLRAGDKPTYEECTRVPGCEFVCNP